MTRVANDLHEHTGKTAGNGSLMRTGPVALAHLGDIPGIVEAARAISGLTHADPMAGDACVLWCLAIDRAVRTGKLDLRLGLPHIDPAWVALVDAAEAGEPSNFTNNGWVVSALQASWSALTRTTSLREALIAAVGAGNDTDTVAAITGALGGARYGSSAVPLAWRRRLHGWPGLRAHELASLAVLTVQGGLPDAQGWPSGERLASYEGAARVVVAHPDDAGVLLGAVGALQPGVADAVVSLCRLGSSQLPLEGIPAEGSHRGSPHRYGRGQPRRWRRDGRRCRGRPGSPLRRQDRAAPLRTCRDKNAPWGCLLRRADHRLQHVSSARPRPGGPAERPPPSLSAGGFGCHRFGGRHGDAVPPHAGSTMHALTGATLT
ncbi:MAG: ADP-ribosylation/Crystallin [Frankiales bacterium]|nr:ADP-ribosylation/Crystallin [Frankiales bacterium]